MNLIEQINLTRWGTSKSDFRKIFFIKKDFIDHPTLNALNFSDVFLGQTMFISAYFMNITEGLGRIIGVLGDLTAQQAEELFEKIVNNLTQIYGNPQYEAEGMRVWQTNDSVISLAYKPTDINPTHFDIGIVWGDKENDPASKDWVKSGLSGKEKPHKDFKLSEAQIAEIKKAIEKSNQA
jgi:hypothetical protein